ncbi:MAG: hypothetical protein KC486_24980, partial [Myxococcales bacterium]|nr:hypothetical protein [Myxococcales bacterium]
MLTWAEIQEHARSKYKLAEDDSDGFKLIWRYDNDRLQQIFVNCYAALGEAWCNFTSPACRRQDLDPATALERSLNFAVGSICLDGDVYVVRYSAPIGSLRLPTFDLLLGVIAST